MEDTRRLLAIWAMVACAAVLAACVPQTEVVKLYESDAGQDRSYERLLVVSVTGDTGTRRRLEELIAGQLGDMAIVGYQETGLKTDLLQDEINDAARNVDADAILVTHFISVDAHLDPESQMAGMVTTCSAGDPVDYSVYDQARVAQPESVEFALTVVAVTNLYDAGNGERLWSIQSTCFEKASMDDVLQDEAKAIVRQLQIDKLVG